METKPKSSHGTIILTRVRMLGEEFIPPEVWNSLVKTPQEETTFLTVADPDQWPQTMQQLREWIENNVPPELWAEMEE